MTKHKSPHLAHVILLLEHEQGNRTKLSAHHSISTLLFQIPHPNICQFLVCTNFVRPLCRNRPISRWRSEAGDKKTPGGFYGRCSSEKIRFKVSSAYPFLSHLTIRKWCLLERCRIWNSQRRLAKKPPPFCMPGKSACEQHTCPHG